MEWGLVFGKWSVIVTQLVVMGVFLYRFALDRQLTDLKKSIAENTAIVKSYEDTEREFVLAQKQLVKAKEAIEFQEVILAAVTEVERITPAEIWYDRVTFTADSLSMTAFSAALPGFGQLLSAAQSSPVFKSIRVGKIESSAARGAQLQFDISMSLTEETKK